MATPPRSVDELLAAAGIDARGGVQIVEVGRFPSAAVDPSLPVLLLRSSGSVAEPLAGRHARRSPLDLLRALYPARHPLRRLDDQAPSALEEVDDAALAAADWLVPPLDALDNVASPHGLPWIANRLRQPDGCPWDRRQDHLSLRRFVLEEAYETVDAIERGDPAELADELGDLLLQVVLHAQLAAEEGRFDLTDVYRAIATKIVRRHPHVFGDVEVTGAEDVVRNWEVIKSAERAESADAGGEPPYERLARVLPALAASRELQERASTAGWDWPSLDGVWDKVHEELAELRSAADAAARRHELGDVLFALVNLARWLDLDPEEALRTANRRWIQRLRAVEALARERGLDLTALPADAKDRLWDEVKHAAQAR
ncbi:MAG: nucleoside triphosphate pyrophosphohydrolase [Chloroflexota bacterium]|nr:nucleoside triphosphate pyrophosphohydrolase [Chloroflexota bacterium]